MTSTSSEVLIHVSWTHSEPFPCFFLPSMDDMAVDSDEEVDYSKMDQVCCEQPVK